MRKLTLTLLLVVLVAIFGLGVALDALFERYTNEPTDEFSHVKNFSDALAHTLKQTDDPQETLKHWPQNAHYRVTLQKREELPLPPELARTFETGEAVVLESAEGVSLYYLLPQPHQVLSIRTGFNTDNKNRHLRLIFTGLFYLGTLLLVLLWLRPLLKRLHRLRCATTAFGTGELSSRVSTQGLSYIQDIENDFNAMADKIQLLINDNKLLTSAVSHDLRTPLARLRFGIDTLAESDDIQSRALYQVRINNDLNEMEHLVNSLLKYAKLDNVLSDAEKDTVQLEQLIRECIAQYYDARIIIQLNTKQVDTNDQLTIIGCIDQLATLFNNLIHNAVDHAHHRLEITLKRADNSIEVEFCDDGPGIPTDLREKVLKPFQRGENSSRKSYGLGLAVADRIARHHNASLLIDDCQHLGGARISVKFRAP